MEAISSCPYCGGKAKLHGRTAQRVVCTKCGAQGPKATLKSEAIKKWNNIKESKDGTEKK